MSSKTDNSGEMVTKTRAQPRTPQPTSIRTPPMLFRQPVTFISPSQLTGDGWRRLVAGAPIVRACVQTLIMQLTGLDWSIEGDEEDAKAYFTKLLKAGDVADGGGMEVWLSRIAKDTMEVPFGGAAELGHFADGVVAWTLHIDGATLVPVSNPRAPYVQVDPFGSTMRPVAFRPEQIGRVRWQAQTDLRAYGWTVTPAQDCLRAIQGLLRADTFWQSFLLDNPPSGILDIPGFDEEEARQWFESWQTMLAGIAPLKVPVLYGAEREGSERSRAQFIELGKSPAETKMMELIKSYAEEVTACFGMTTSDLGLFGQEMRLAGATKMMDLSKRQGLGRLMRGFKGMIDNDILPDGLEFKWSDVDAEDKLRTAQTREIGSRRIKNLVDGQIISSKEGRRVAVLEEIVPADAIDEDHMDEFDEAPVKPKGDEDVDITDEELGPDDKPTTQAVEEDQERAFDPELIQAFPLTSKWATRMARVADRLMRGARQRFTKKRALDLLSLGLTAYQEGAGAVDANTITRSAADAEEALRAALTTVDWWKSPDLVDEVAVILRGAYEEGAMASISTIEASRVELGLAAINLGTTTFNLTNESVIALIRSRAGAFIRHIDDGTRTTIVQSIMGGVREGISSPSIARGILADQSRRDLLEIFKNRTMSIVNTEINWAESHAALEEQTRLGLTKKRWNSIPGIRCPLCERNTNKGAVAADFEFESVFGSTMAPPGHPGVCHCYITFDKEELRALGDLPSYWFGG